jgi:Na+/H+-dicarboxylate symporter
LEGVGLILAVDRVLDMFRTAVNVWSDSCGAAVIAKSEGEVLNYTKSDTEWSREK